MNEAKPSPSEIKAARRKSGLTQEKAAALIGYSLRTWQEWEGGRRIMRRSTLNYFLVLSSK